MEMLIKMPIFAPLSDNNYLKQINMTQPKMKRTMFLTMLLLLVGVNTQAQSVSTEQMDERFNNNKLPYG